MDLIDRLLKHDRWATDVLLESCRGLSDAQLDQEFDIGHRTVRATLSHMIFNVGFWTGLMAGKPIDEVTRVGSLSDLAGSHAQDYEAFASLAYAMRDEQRLDETYVDHYSVTKSFGGTIIQVVEHNAEHRTEILHMLERLGVREVPEIDHGLWDYLVLAGQVQP